MFAIAQLSCHIYCESFPSIAASVQRIRRATADECRGAARHRIRCSVKEPLGQELHFTLTFSTIFVDFYCADERTKQIWFTEAITLFVISYVYHSIRRRRRVRYSSITSLFIAVESMFLLSVCPLVTRIVGQEALLLQSERATRFVTIVTIYSDLQAHSRSLQGYSCHSISHTWFSVSLLL